MAGKDDVNGLNESPYEKVGKSAFSAMVSYKNCLNESPYEKVGKFSARISPICRVLASMKVPTKK